MSWALTVFETPSKTADSANRWWIRGREGAILDRIELHAIH
jgi:hypothetical protein